MSVETFKDPATGETRYACRRGHPYHDLATFAILCDLGHNLDLCKPTGLGAPAGVSEEARRLFFETFPEFKKLWRRFAKSNTFIKETPS